MYEELKQLMKKYISRGLVIGGELALPKEYALTLCDDLSELGVSIEGLDGWRARDTWKTPMQDLSVDYSIDNYILKEKDASQKTTAMIKQFIRDKVPDDISFISFSLNIPVEWDLFSPD